jgi:hypothetical protein
MSKRTVFTTVTPLPPGITREIVIETLHSHEDMIDLNPLVEERHPIKPPNDASPEEYHCLWYQLTDRVSYLPGGIMSGKVSYNACFHDLDRGLQTHCYAPLGLNIKGKWTLGGSLPGEPVGPVELGIGAPLSGLYLREDVDMRCNIMMTSFVKKTLKKAHSHLVDRLLIKSQILGAAISNQNLTDKKFETQNHFSGSQSNTQYSPASDYGDSPGGFEENPTRRDPLNSNPPQYGAPRLPPLQGLGFGGPTSPDFREKGNQESILYPQALSFRNSSASYNGSYVDSQRDLGSYQDSLPESVRSGRVSWQNLQPNRSPSLQQMDPAYQQAVPTYQQAALPYPLTPHPESNPHRASVQSYHAELPSNERMNAPRKDQRTKPVYGAAELE